ASDREDLEGGQRGVGRAHQETSVHRAATAYALLLRSRLLHDWAVDDFLRDVALYNPEVVDPDTLEARAAELGLTRGLARTAVVLDVRAGQDGTAAVSRISLLRTVREFFGGSEDLAREITAGRYAALHAMDTVHGDLSGRCQLACETG